MNDRIIKSDNEINNIFDNIKELVITSRNKVYSAVNTEMLNLYWNIGNSNLGNTTRRWKSHLWGCSIRKTITEVNRWIWQRIFQKKFGTNEKILYLLSNYDNTVVAIELVTLLRINKDRRRKKEFRINKD